MGRHAGAEKLIMHTNFATTTHPATLQPQPPNIASDSVHIFTSMLKWGIPKCLRKYRVPRSFAFEGRDNGNCLHEEASDSSCSEARPFWLYVIDFEKPSPPTIEKERELSGVLY